MQADSPKLTPLRYMARQLRVSAEWLRAEAEAGRVPHLKAGDQYLFAPEAVEAVLLSRAKRIESEAGQ